MLSSGHCPSAVYADAQPTTICASPSRAEYNECQRRYLAEYLTGLFVAERKTVLGIHDEFAQTTDQSCLNRFLTEAVWDVEALNRRRLELLQKDPTTRYSDQGVIPIDNTLIDRDGLLIPDAARY